MSDAASTQSTQTTTSQQASTAPQHGELLAEVERLRGETERFKNEANEWKTLAVNNMPQQQYQQPAQQQAFSYQQQTPQRPPASLLLENPDEYDRRLEAWVNSTNQQAWQQAASFVTPQLASTGKYLSQSDPRNADVWSKWGSEIELAMAKSGLSPMQQTKEAWDTVVKFIKSDHIDEIAYEKAQKLSQGGGFGTESGSAAGGAPSAASDTLATFWSSDHQWVQRAKGTGMTLQQLRSHVASQQVSEQQWVDDITKGRSFRAEAA